MIGSPPQVRGKQSVYKSVCAVPRITPAGAGKTSSSYRTTIHLQDHPRRCGENYPSRSSHESNTGSPPQVRGKPLKGANSSNTYGITPAGAGKTDNYRARRARQRDHPRRCGENAPFLRRTVRRPGSPPQVRGKLAAFHAAPAARRITPAGAGKTHRGVLRSCRRKDHPRRCGENEMQIITARVSEGSPPQVRGKPERAFYCPLVLGITPAGAGKTPRLSATLQ